MSRLKDLTGQRFGKLVVLSITEDYVSKSGHRLKQWQCQCDCGNICVATGCNLKEGRQVSCGCHRREATRKRRLSHGMSGTSIHNTWMSMIQRCEDKGNKNYPRWGGRGIKVCQRWRESFEAFYEDVSKLENFNTPGYTLDRYPDIDGDYAPGNVRWASPKQQANNTRQNRIWTYNGESHTVAEWADILNVSPFTLYHRQSDLNWPVEKILSTPIRKRAR